MKNDSQFSAKNYLKTRQTTLRQAVKSYPVKIMVLFFQLFSITFFVAAAKPGLKTTGTGNDSYSVNSLNDAKVSMNQEKPEDNSFISLFNCKDLSGWCYRSKSPGNNVFESFEGKTESTDSRYMAKDSMLTINPWDEAKGPHWVNLWTLKEFTSDFILTVEFRASPNADSGIFLRGKQLQCRDYLVAGPYKELKNYQPQDWNKIEVVVKNNIAHCTCNGEILEEALQIPGTGSIGLEADRGRMDYRNIRIKEL